MKILYIGHYKESSGWANSAIDHILAIDSVGVPIVCRDIKLTNKDYSLPSRITELERNNLEDVTHCIQHVLPHHILGSSLFKKNIAYLEAETIHTKKNMWHSSLDLVDEVWVPNDTLKENTEKFVKNKVSTIHHTFNTEKYKESYNSIDFGCHQSCFKFYFIGDVTNRKNIQSIIRSYYHTFSPRDNTLLVLKLNKFNIGPEELDQQCQNMCVNIQREMRLYNDSMNYPAIRFITSPVTDEEIQSLHYSCDCFVSPSYGEAWSIPSFEAMCFGNTPICSNEGGPKTFIDPDNKWSGTLVDGVYDICNQQDGAFNHIFTGSEFWFHPSEKKVSEAMRYYYNNRHKKDKTKSYMLGEKFNYNTVGNKIKESLNE